MPTMEDLQGEVFWLSFKASFVCYLGFIIVMLLIGTL